MLVLKNPQWRNWARMGQVAIVDPDWDELFLPPLTFGGEQLGSGDPPHVIQQRIRMCVKGRWRKRKERLEWLVVRLQRCKPK